MWPGAEGRARPGLAQPALSSGTSPSAPCAPAGWATMTSVCPGPAQAGNSVTVTAPRHSDWPRAGSGAPVSAVRVAPTFSVIFWEVAFSLLGVGRMQARSCWRQPWPPPNAAADEERGDQRGREACWQCGPGPGPRGARSRPGLFGFRARHSHSAAFLLFLFFKCCGFDTICLSCFSLHLRLKEP